MKKKEMPTELKATKNAYSSPSLIIYGNIAQITEGGVGSMVETDAPLIEPSSTSAKDYRP